MNFRYLDQNIKHFFLQISNKLIFFTKQSNPNHIYRIQLILSLQISINSNETFKLTYKLDSRKNFALPDTLSRKTQPELLIRKTTVAIPQTIKSITNKQITTFPTLLDCQNN